MKNMKKLSKFTQQLYPALTSLHDKREATEGRIEMLHLAVTVLWARHDCMIRETPQ